MGRHGLPRSERAPSRRLHCDRSVAPNLLSEAAMNWDQVKGDALQVKGILKQKWAKLTDDDLLLLEGQKDAFLGMLESRTGLAKELAEKELDLLLGALDLDRKQPGVIHLSAS